MSDKNCVVVGGSAKEYGMNKMHNKGSWEVPEAQMSTTAWLPQRKRSFFPDAPREGMQGQWGRALATELIGP